MSKLYQYFKGNLQRVDKRLESLSSRCAYLLVTEAAVCLFIGGTLRPLRGLEPCGEC